MPSYFMSPLLRGPLNTDDDDEGGGGETEGDVTAPILELATGVATGATTATIGVTTNDGGTTAGGLYGQVRTTSTPAAGTELVTETGTFVTSVFGNLSGSGAGIKTFDVTGLTEDVPVYVHWAQKDAYNNISNVVVSAAFTPEGVAISNQNIEFGGLTANNAGGAKARDSDGNQVDFVSVDAVVSGTGTGWSVSGGLLIRSSAPATSHDAVLTCTTTLGVIDVTIKASGVDENGWDLALGRSVKDMTELVAAWQNTALRFGDVIFLRTGAGLYNPTHSFSLRPNLLPLDNGPFVEPSLLDEDHPDKGYDLDSANFMVVTKHAGDDPIIAMLHPNGAASPHQYVRITGLKFNHAPLAPQPNPGVTFTSTGLSITLNFPDYYAIDNCEFWSVTDELLASQGQIFCGLLTGRGRFWIQDNHFHDLAYAISSNGSTSTIVGNTIETFWAGAMQINPVADVLCAWNEVNDARNFDLAYLNVHADFIQYDDANCGALPRTGIRFVCNRLQMGAFDHVATPSGAAQGLFGSPANGIGLNYLFSTSAAWVLGAGWTINSGGRATSAANGTSISQVVSLIEGQTYELIFTIAGYTAGGVTPTLLGGTPVTGTTVTANGTYVIELVAGAGNTSFGFVAVGTTTLRVTRASLVMPLEGMVVAGNIMVVSAGNLISLSHIKDSFFYNNSIVNDPEDAQQGWMEVFYGRANTIKYNVTQDVRDVFPNFSALTIEDNTEIDATPYAYNTAAMQAAYAAVFNDPEAGPDITDLADQYDILTGSVSDLADRGANSRFIDWENREHNFPIVLEANLTLQNIPGLRAVPFGNVSRGGVSWSSLNSTTLDATGESYQIIGTIITSDGEQHTLDNTGSIEWRASTVVFAATGPSSTFKVGIADVDPALGPPGRAVHASDIVTYDVNGTYVSGTNAPTTLAWNVTPMTTGSRIIQDGDEFAIVLQMVSRAGADSVIVQSVLTTLVNQYPFVTTFTGGAYASPGHAPNAIIRFGDGAEGYFVGGIVASSTSSIAFNSGSATKEYGNAFELDHPIRVTGVQGVLTPTGSFEYILYLDPFGTPVATRTKAFDLHTFGAASSGLISAAFDEYLDIPANTPFAMVVRPTTVTSVTLTSMTMNAAGDAEAYPGASYAISRASGAFAVVNTNKDHYPIGPMLGGFDDGA